MRRLQAIDIGTNSVRSIVVEVPDSGSFEVIDDEKVTVRLGEGLHASGRLSEDAMQRAVDALRPMLDIGRSLGVDEVCAIATAAARTAANRDELLTRLDEQLGLEVQVISEEEEGRLVFLSASANFDLAGPSAVLDIGGGSAEIVRAAGGQIEQVVSLPIGARVLAEEFVGGDPIGNLAFRAMRRTVRDALRDAVVATPGVARLIGSGGTVTSAAAMTAAARGRRIENLQGAELDRNDVVRLLALLRHSTAAERRSMPGLPPERADIILPGVVVLFEAMRLLDADRVSVNARGIREGIVLDMLRRAGHADRQFSRLDGVLAFARRCNADMTHAEQVTRLALSLFDQLAEPLGLDEGDRPLLEAAGMLHDVGYLISYDKHHKHSYHLIVHAGLPGFSEREQRTIAAVARYHAKGMPKARHEAIAALDSRDRQRVDQLSAVLRVADGLDRSRASAVGDVVARSDGGLVYLYLRGAGDMHAEVYGVERKKDLFEKVFGRPVVAVVDRLETPVTDSQLRYPAQS